MRTRNIALFALMTGLLLLIPLVAMQYTSEVVWSPFDFLFAGILLFGSGLTYELVAGRVGNAVYKAAVAVTVLATLFLIWANLAVGLIGTEDNPANVLYGGVLAVELIGAAGTRFRPKGLSRTMFTAAVVQVLIPVISFTLWNPEGADDLWKVIRVTGFFVVLFIVAALLFRQAGEQEMTKNT